MQDEMRKTDKARLRGYAIIGAKRCGSSHLCALLASTGLLGVPDEYFHPCNLDYDDQSTQARAQAAWDRIVARATTSNGITGFKVFYGHINQPGMASFRERIAACKFVLLERQDRLAQAISLARALQTGSWSTHQPALTVPLYEPARITECLGAIASELACWEDLLGEYGVVPLRIDYDNLLADPVTTVAVIARHMGIDPATLPPLRSGKRIQRDKVSEEWQQRYLAENGL